MVWALGQDLVNSKQPLLETIGTTIRKVTSVKLTDNKPEGSFHLYNNYPNPFNPSTNFQFRIPEFGFVSLKIYDVLGREVATLVNEEKPSGEYRIDFNAEKYNLSSGVYFYTLKAAGFRQTKEMLLLK